MLSDLRATTWTSLWSREEVGCLEARSPFCSMIINMSCCALTCILITYIIAVITILLLENGLWFEAWVTRRTLGVEGKPVESGTIPEQRAVVSEKKMAIGDEDNYMMIIDEASVMAKGKQFTFLAFLLLCGKILAK